VKEEDLPANTNQAIAIIKGTSHVFEPEFLRLFLLSKLALDQVASKARGGAMNNVSLDDIRDIIIPIPPRSEQQLIISSVNVLFEHADAIERGVAVEKKRTEILTQAILGKVFRGELITYETKNC
jgi:type I restriction enzyme S subunit